MGCCTAKPKVAEDENIEPEKRTPEIAVKKLPPIPKELKSKYEQISDMFIMDSVWTGTMQFEDSKEMLEIKFSEVISNEETFIIYDTQRPILEIDQMSSAHLKLCIEFTEKDTWILKMKYEDSSIGKHFLLLEASGMDAFDVEKCKVTGRCGIPNQKPGSFMMVRAITPNKGLPGTRSTRTFSENTWGGIMNAGSLAHKAYLKQEEKRKSDFKLKYSSNETIQDSSEDLSPSTSPRTT